MVDPKELQQEGEEQSAAESVEAAIDSSEARVDIADSGDESLSTGLPLRAQIGALLFVAQRPLTTAALAEAAKSTVEEIEHELEQLKATLAQAGLGFKLNEIAGAWQMRTVPEAARTVHRLIPPRARKLSRAAAETLAIIAYKQPVQRAEIEAIRGVDALPTLKTLLDAKLIRIVGRSELAGHPALYGTTTIFLEKFGLKDLSELPTVRELELFAKDPGEGEEDDVVAEAVEGQTAGEQDDLLETAK